MTMMPRMAASDASHSLPALPKLPAKEMAGPTPWSNWALPGRVIAGAYPASLDDAETERILTTLLELGINTFVCLQAEVNINTPEHAWRSQHGLRPYIKDAQKILSKAHETGNPRITQQKIDFLHLPIIDGNVTTDSAMNRLAEDCIERVLRGEKMYIHCWGGHGRTGTLIAVMLGRLYNLPYTNALRYTQAFHDSRVYPQGVRSPQTPVQRAQVRRLLAAQSAMVSSAPTPGAVSSGMSRSAVPQPISAGSRAAAAVNRSAIAGYLNSGSSGAGAGLATKVGQGGGLLSAASGSGGAGLGARASSDMRSSQAPPSPLRARPSSMMSSSSPSGVRGLAPAKDSPADVSKAQGPAGARAAGSVGRYIMPQR